jgi:hypothetical protein
VSAREDGQPIRLDQDPGSPGGRLRAGGGDRRQYRCAECAQLELEAGPEPAGWRRSPGGGRHRGSLQSPRRGPGGLRGGPGGLGGGAGGLGLAAAERIGREAGMILAGRGAQLGGKAQLTAVGTALYQGDRGNNNERERAGPSP